MTRITHILHIDQSKKQQDATKEHTRTQAYTSGHNKLDARTVEGERQLILVNILFLQKYFIMLVLAQLLWCILLPLQFIGNLALWTIMHPQPFMCSSAAERRLLASYL